MVVRDEPGPCGFLIYSKVHPAVGTSFNGRTPRSGRGYWGSNPYVPAIEFGLCSQYFTARGDFTIELPNERPSRHRKAGPSFSFERFDTGISSATFRRVGAVRPRVLAASMSLVLILSGRVVVQTKQNRPPITIIPRLVSPARASSLLSHSRRCRRASCLCVSRTSQRPRRRRTQRRQLAPWFSGPERSGCSRLAQWAYGLPVGRSSRRLGRFPMFRPRQVTCWTSTKPISAPR